MPKLVFQGGWSRDSGAGITVTVAAIREKQVSPPSHKLARYGWQPADPPRRPVLFVNPRSGGGTAARAGIAERARQSAIEVVMLTPGQSLPALARAAVANGADALGMAGGDGSLAVVAAVAAANRIPFVCCLLYTSDAADE